MLAYWHEEEVWAFLKCHGEAAVEAVGYFYHGAGFVSTAATGSRLPHQPQPAAHGGARRREA